MVQTRIRLLNNNILIMKSVPFRIKNFHLKRKQFQMKQSKQQPRLHKYTQSGDTEQQIFQYNQTNDFMDLFKKMLLNLKNTVTSNQKREDVQVRDRHYILQIPEGTQYQSKKQSIKKWLQKMVSNIVSIAFNYFLNDEITYEQVKIYCSENILKNIAALNQKYKLKPDELKEIDDFIQDQVINYLLKKYPLTETIVESKALGQVAKAPNETEKLVNDFLSYGNINFQLRETQTYDDLIKQLINQIINRINRQSNLTAGMSNFDVFHRMMTRVFEVVQDRSQMQNQIQRKQRHVTELVQTRQNKSKSIGISSPDAESQQNRRNYRQKVRQYTHYLIGRKISQNVSSYSDEQIKNKSIALKSPGILRILTKWCEELWSKFIPKNYFLNKTQDFILANKQMRSLSSEMRSHLDKLMQIEKLQIKKFMSKMVKQNSQIQINLLNQLLDSSEEQFWEQDLQRISGKFSVLVGKNLQKWVVKYLNRLIHGLLKVAKQFHQKYLSREWPSPPNLITFRIGDLMRCKCSSGQRQILRIFKEIKCISETNPEIIKIIRIKDRLSLGTNDILINVRFSNLIVCQIQLAVNSRKSKFIKSSNYVSHYLYEVQRSLFGPINELCSIWRNLDMRSLYYDKNIGKQIGSVKGSEHKCQTNKKSFQLQVFEGPFICSICNRTYSQNNLIIKHVKCSQCAYWKCGKCQITLASAKQLSQMLIQQNLKSYCVKKYQTQLDSINLPTYGICIKINDSRVKPIIFKKIFMRGAQYLFTLQNNSVLLVSKLVNEAALKQFIEDFLIFQISQFQGPSLIQLSVERVQQDYFLPAHVLQCYKQHKDSILLQNQPLNSQNCHKIFKGSAQQRQLIRHVQLNNVQLGKIQALVDIFPNLQKLHLSDNKKLQVSQSISGFSRLKHLSLKNMAHLQQMPQQICAISSLQILQLKGNNFKSLPQAIQNLSLLKELDISRSQAQNLKNFIRELPAGLFRLTHLQKLNLSYQWIFQLSEDIGNLKQLTYLNIRRNNLKVLPDSISNLTKLEHLDISMNPFERLPQKMSNLKRLKRFQLKQIGGHKFNVMGDEFFRNSMSTIPSDLEEIPNLVTLEFHSEYLQSLPSLIKCSNLEEINFQRCSLSAFPELQSCTKLRRVNLKQQLSSDPEKQLKTIPNSFVANAINIEYFCASYNYIETIPDNINMLKKLQQLSLQYNNISILAQELGQCQSLTKINLWHNKIKSLPASIQNLINLQQLNLGQNFLTEFSQNLTKCIKLREIKLFSNRIGNIPENIMKLVEVQMLNLQNNLISVVPSSLKRLRKMKAKSLKLANNPIYLIGCPQYLNSFGCQHTVQLNRIVQGKEFYYCNFHQKIDKISSDIGKASSLKIINISQNALKSFPKQIEELSSLQRIQFNNNLFQVFPCSITKCKNIKNISCKKNLIVSLPQQMGNMRSLTDLDVESNKISFISDQLNNCINLTSINLDSNELALLSPNNFKGLNKLVKISLCYNKITEFPCGLLQCSNLEEILISDNLITSVTGDFGKMTQLKTLNICYNKLKHFPQSLLVCPALVKLLMSNNQIQVLSQQIYQMNKLMKLELNSNKIRSIPRPKRQCKTLEGLQLANNLIQIVVAQLSLLTNMHEEQLNLYNNPIKSVECWEWAKKAASPATLNILRKLEQSKT